ncbi:MAG: MotA/TolQ/ExbB proton channel family protein [Clostridiaceae bacterium]|nr:MotA/TolQ/ExbB proton channel family protein [Clostridiaceae bacterium]
MFGTLASLYDQMGLLGFIITVLIAVFFLIGFYVNILVRRCYLSLSQELAAFCDGDLNEFKSDMLTWVTEEYKESLLSGVKDINTPAIIDLGLEAFLKPCIIGENYLRKVNGLLITLGLFGTFLGLTSAIGDIGTMMTETSAETLMTEAGANTLKILISSFRGMSVAFITSLFGTGFSIMFTGISTFFGAQNSKNLFIAQLEEYLDIRVASSIMEDIIKKEKNEKDEIQIIAETLTNSVALFSKTVNDYTEELSFLNSFNKELRNNICQVENSIASFSHSLEKTSDAFNTSSMFVKECSEEFKYTCAEIKKYNHQLESMSHILSQLSEKLDHTNEDRAIYLKTINEIPDRLLNYTEAAVAKVEKM